MFLKNGLLLTCVLAGQGALAAKFSSKREKMSDGELQQFLKDELNEEEPYVFGNIRNVQKIAGRPLSKREIAYFVAHIDRGNAQVDALELVKKHPVRDPDIYMPGFSPTLAANQAFVNWAERKAEAEAEAERSDKGGNYGRDEFLFGAWTALSPHLETGLEYQDAQGAADNLGPVLTAQDVVDNFPDPANFTEADVVRLALRKFEEREQKLKAASPEAAFWENPKKREKKSLPEKKKPSGTQTAFPSGETSTSPGENVVRLSDDELSEVLKSLPRGEEDGGLERIREIEAAVGRPLAKDEVAYFAAHRKCEACYPSPLRMVKRAGVASGGGAGQFRYNPKLAADKAFVKWAEAEAAATQPPATINDYDELFEHLVKKNPSSGGKRTGLCPDGAVTSADVAQPAAAGGLDPANYKEADVWRLALKGLDRARDLERLQTSLLNERVNTEKASKEKPKALPRSSSSSSSSKSSQKVSSKSKAGASKGKKPFLAKKE